MTKADQQTPRALILKLLTLNKSSSDGGGDETAVDMVWTGLITVCVSPLHERCHWGLAQSTVSHRIPQPTLTYFEFQKHMFQKHMHWFFSDTVQPPACIRNKHISCVLHDGTVWLFLHTADGKQMFIHSRCGWQSTADLRLLSATFSHLVTLLKSTGWHVNNAL